MLRPQFMRPLSSVARQSFFQPTLRQTTPLSSRFISIPSTPVAAMSSSVVSANSVIELIKNRRSHYPLSKDLSISKERIAEIVKEATLHVPSSFNAQSTRVVVLFGAEHEKLWDITAEALKGLVPAENWKPTGDKLNMFKGAAGSVR